MFHSFRRHLIAFLVVVAGIAPLPALAGITSLTVFGDSLSDTGNIFLATGGAVPGAPYYAGRFSNGPIWVDGVAAGLGLPNAALPSLAGGTNYAFGGARTGTSATPPGLVSQVVGLWGPVNPVADPTGVYVLMGGGNDMRDARSTYTGTTAADDAGRQAAAEAAAANLAANMAFLAARGATTVMLSTLPDLGVTPEAALLGVQAASTDAASRYNAEVAALVPYGVSLGLEVLLLDLDPILDAIFADALDNGGALYGITNVFTPCGAFPGAPAGADCSVSLFSDALHASSRAHAIIAAEALRLLTSAAIDEPPFVAMAALGMMLLVLRKRRMQRLQ